VLEIVRYLAPGTSLWSTRKRGDFSGLVRKNHDLLSIDTRYTISKWSEELFDDMDAIEQIPTDKANELRISLVQYLMLVNQILTRGVAGMQLRPSIPRRLVTEVTTVVSNKKSWYVLIPISFEQQRVLFHRDYLQSSKRWSRLLSGPKLMHERRMSLESYMEELKQVRYELPLRWLVSGVGSMGEILLLPRNPRFFDQLCINSASYISLEDWKSETRNLFLFYSPISKDWSKEQLRRAHCLSRTDLRSSLATGREQDLDKQVLLWNESKHEPNPFIRFYRLPGAEAWIDDASAQLLLKDSASERPGLAAYFLLPIGQASVGTIDALRGVHSSFHGTEQTIYHAVPFIREWGAMKAWPEIFAWLYRFASNLFSVTALSEFFQTIFVDLQTVAFQSFVNRLHTDMSMTSPFHPFEIIMFALTARDRPKWNGMPSTFEVQSAVNNLAVHYTTWRAAQNLSFGLRQANAHISALGQTLSDAEVKLGQSMILDPTKQHQHVRIRHHWTGFSKSIEPHIETLVQNQYLSHKPTLTRLLVQAPPAGATVVQR
jgi:hypothetical protein